MTNPDLIPVPFAANGDKNTIPLDRIASDPVYMATWLNGFPSDTRIPEDIGGEAPDGLDFNGLFNALSQAVVFLQRGNNYQFDDGLSPYPLGALVRSDDYLTTFQSTISSNPNNPNSNMTGWKIYSGNGFVIDNLTTDDSGKPVSAKQGKILQDTKISRTLVTTPINADTENTTGVRIINGLGNTNLPLNTYGALNVYSNENFAIGALRVYQTFQPDIFSDLFFRKWDGAFWSAWERAVKFSEKNTEAFGVGQTQQWLTPWRFANTTYINSTGKPIEVRIYVKGGVSSVGNTVQVGGVDIYVFDVHSTMTASFCFTVQAGETYRINGTATINSWSELR